MRAMIDRDPFYETFGEYSYMRGRWEDQWVACPGADRAPLVAAYRLKFSSPAQETVRVHVTAGERYELFLDGKRVGRGSERGSPQVWFFETYDLDLSAGEHLLVARVWSQGTGAPVAQMVCRDGFLLAADKPEDRARLSTGHAAWEAKPLPGYEFSGEYSGWFIGTTLKLYGSEMDWAWLSSESDGWREAIKTGIAASGFCCSDFSMIVAEEGPSAPQLWPAILPPMMEAQKKVGTVRFAALVKNGRTETVPVVESDNDIALAASWSSLVKGESSLTVPAGSVQRVIVDLDDYYCAFPELVASGGKGGSVRVLWAESLYTAKLAHGDSPKGNRDEIWNKCFQDGYGDVFNLDGGAKRFYDTLWWHAGRYLEILIDAKDEAVTIDSFGIRETRYPMEMESSFNFSDKRLEAPVPVMFRALQMCSHETYMDCPYYEQLMYVGDTRLEVLATYCTVADSRLPKKAVKMFGESQLNSGLTQSRFPSRGTQIIPPFSLWWVGMVYDYALWRGDLDFVRQQMRRVRAVLDHFLGWIGEDGLLVSPEGWNFTDWVPSWKQGIPAGGNGGKSGVLNWHLVLVLSMAQKLESWLGEEELAARYGRLCAGLAEKVSGAFWDDSRKLFADDLDKTLYSEHAQCLAILSSMLPAARESAIVESMIAADGLAQTTIYFSHYLLETFTRHNRMDAFMEKMSLWFELVPQGFKTTFEAPGNTRSDCHAWGAHPLYHYYSSILGVRPGDVGFKSVEIRPRLGSLENASGKLVHPRGIIEVDFKRLGDDIDAVIVLPDGLAGVAISGGETVGLKPGRQTLKFKAE